MLFLSVSCENFMICLIQDVKKLEIMLADNSEEEQEQDEKHEPCHVLLTTTPCYPIRPDCVPKHVQSISD